MMTRQTEFRMVAGAATFTLLLIIGACFSRAPEPTGQSELPPEFITSTMWVHHNTGVALQVHENVYGEIVSRHPQYGIARYMVRDSAISQDEERSYVTESLQQIRERFGDAYRDGTLTYYCPPRDCDFDLKYVCVLLLDMLPRADEKSYGLSHKVGFIFSADAVFAKDVDVAAIFDRALMRDIAPLEYDPSKTKLPDGFVDVTLGTFYRIIERHSAKQAERAAAIDE